ncbi:MAG: cytochrome P450 [Steroidobacteraceae bacterium]
MSAQEEQPVASREVDRYSMADPAVQRCPLGYYAAMRREDPVHQDPGTGFWWVARHDTVARAAMDATTFSSKSPLVVKKALGPRARALWNAAGMEVLDTLVTGDPPEHEHYRAVGVSLFNQKKVEELASAIERRVNEILDALGERTECDFVADFACWLPSSIVCDEFGLPPQDRQRFKTWTDSVFGLMVPGITEDEEVAHVETLIELFRYLEGHIVRAQSEPSGRVIHALATMPRKDGTAFSILERSWMAVATFVGGNDTTIGMLAAGVARLAKNPELQQLLRRDPGRMPNFVDELLRLESSVQSLMRVATRDVEVDGTVIPRGSNVLLCTASANRDEAHWPEPDAFKLDRPDARRHLGFGRGIHTCIGMHLARRELQIAFDVLLRRWHDIELTIDDVDSERVPLPFHRAYARLPVRFRRADA